MPGTVAIRRALLLCLALPCAHAMADASAPSPLDAAWQRISTLATDGSADAYASGYIWHDPHTYTAQKRAVLNSEGWGGGWGKQLDCAGGHDMVFAMAFLDSHRDVEPVLGYARQWTWSLAHSPASVGLGYTAGLTSRADIAHNLPFPIVLPLASISWGRFTVFGTFIPRLNGLPNNGNVGFVFASYKLGD